MSRSSAEGTSSRSGSRAAEGHMARRRAPGLSGFGRRRRKSGRQEIRNDGGPRREIHAVGGPARHIPVLLGEVLDALEPARRARRSSTARSAQAAIRGAACGRRQRHRDRSRSRCDPAGARSREAAFAGRLSLVHAPFSRLDEYAGQASTASCSTSASPRCSSTRPSAASPSAPTARSTCAWRKAGPTRCRRGQPLQARRPRPHLRLPRRGAACRPHRPHDREAAREAAVRTHARPCRCDRDAGRTQPEGQDPSGDARLPGAAHLRQRRTRRTCAARCLPPSARSSPAAGWPSSRSIRSRTASSSASSPTAPASRRGSRHLPEAAVIRPRPSTNRAARSRPSDAEIAANPRARSAKLRAAVRTAAPARPVDMTMFGLPELARQRLVRRRGSSSVSHQRHRADRRDGRGRRLHLQDQARGGGPAGRRSARSRPRSASSRTPPICSRPTGACSPSRRACRS